MTRPKRANPLAKDFATTISLWVVPLEALAPYRVPAAPRAQDDPAPLPYLNSPTSSQDGFEVTLEASLQSARMRQAAVAPMLMSRGNLRDIYWSIRQLVTHHASKACNLRPGDLLAAGTISGAEAGSEDCLLEKSGAHEPIRLPTGELREFLEDTDEVIFGAYASKEGLLRIGFGECRGTILKAGG